MIAEPKVNETPEVVEPSPKEEGTWIEEIEVTGNQLVERVKELFAEANVRRLILRTPDDKLLLEIPLTAGAVVGGVVTLFAPLLAILGVLAVLVSHMKVEIVRVEEESDKQE
jgi:uncharacterized membrane protein YoaK (UPF0700 family)